MIIALERIQNRSCPHYPRWWGDAAAAGRLPCLVGSSAGRLVRTFLRGSTERHYGNGRLFGVRLSPLRTCEYSTSFGDHGQARTGAACLCCLLCEPMTLSFDRYGTEGAGSPLCPSWAWRGGAARTKKRYSAYGLHGSCAGGC